MNGIRDLVGYSVCLQFAFSDTRQFWAPGNFELVVLAHSHEQRE